VVSVPRPRAGEPDPTPDALAPVLARAWHPVAPLDDVARGPVGAQLLGQDVVVARLDGELRAFVDLCVHRGTKLSLGWVDGACLVCPYHGWAYDADGTCVRIPALRDGHIPARARVPRLAVAEHLGMAWVCLDPERALPLPELPELDDPTFRVIACPPYDWACAAPRRIENFVDFAHFPWVHDGVLGRRDAPEVPDHEIWREGLELRIRQLRVEPRNDDVKTAGLGLDGGTVTTEMRYRVFIPTAARLEQHLPGGRRYVVLLACAPTTGRTTRTWWWIARNYDLDAPDERFVRFQQDIVGDDRPIVESQRPERLPVDLAVELHLRDVDRVSLAYRRWLRELLAEEPA
jgi:vanillate O-demethylase monooxygenase subunit